MGEQLTLIEQRPDRMPPITVFRLSRLTSALLERTGVIVGVEIEGWRSPPYNGYTPSGDETRRTLSLPPGHAGRWGQFFWRFLAEGGARRDDLYDAPGIIDFVTGTKDDISYTDQPAPRQYSPAKPNELAPGATYELFQDGRRDLTVYGSDDPTRCLTVPRPMHPLVITSTVALMVERECTDIQQFTPAQPSQ